MDAASHKMNGGIDKQWNVLLRQFMIEKWIRNGTFGNFVFSMTRECVTQPAKLYTISFLGCEENSAYIEIERTRLGTMACFSFSYIHSKIEANME